MLHESGAMRTSVPSSSSLAAASMQRTGSAIVVVRPMLRNRQDTRLPVAAQVGSFTFFLQFSDSHRQVI